MNGTVYALAVDGSGNLYAGGDFTNAGGASANRIAKWNGFSWSALGSGVDDVVEALAVDGSGDVYAGGRFATAGGVAANRIAKWDGSSWLALPFTHILAHTISTHPPATEKIPCTLAAACCTPAR